MLNWQLLLCVNYYLPSAHLICFLSKINIIKMPYVSPQDCFIKTKNRGHLNFKTIKQSLYTASFYLDSANQNPVLPWKPRAFCRYEVHDQGSFLKSVGKQHFREKHRKLLFLSLAHDPLDSERLNFARLKRIISP